MNHPFIKMLRFEWKSNYMMWIFNLIIGVGLLTTLYFMGNRHNSIFPIFIFPIFLMITCVNTINSYQESTKSQSMQMYHLIPVSRNTKFFSKQLITLFAYPLILALLAELFIEIIRIFVNTPEVYYKYDLPSHLSNQSNMTALNFLLTWIFAHAVSTLFAVIFKKNKILYAFLALFGFQFILSITMAIYISTLNLRNGDRVPGIFANLDKGDWMGIVFLFVSVALYGISYHLFFRRQL